MVFVIIDTVIMEPGMQYAWRVTASDVSGVTLKYRTNKSEDLQKDLEKYYPLK
jgi:hypothetical protein